MGMNISHMDRFRLRDHIILSNEKIKDRKFPQNFANFAILSTHVLMSLLIGFFVLSITISFLCSIWEAVLLSITPSYIKRAEKENPEIFLKLSSFKTDIDKPLSAILTLNTIAHTVGAIGVGAQAGVIFGEKSANLLGIPISYESIVAALMTLAILYLSEILPKTIGANNWQSLAPFATRSISILIFILKPFILISNLMTKALKKEKGKSIFSIQDFAAMTDMVGESGELGKSDYNLIKNVLKFDELSAYDVMTPRTIVKMAEESLKIIDYYNQIKDKRIFSRIPLYAQSRDYVTGLLLKDELFQAIIEGRGEDTLSTIKRTISVVDQDQSLRSIFEILNENRDHMAMVMDEFGGMQGLITQEDIIETLLGYEILDEKDQISDLQEYARKKWEERAKKYGLIEE